MSASISIENLTKYYGKFLALNGLSLNVEPNENIGFFGVWQYLFYL